jgi:diadenosine tetraphosphate (Ap4A) HIT family hydrolase
MESCPYCYEIKRGFFEFKNKNYGNRILFESDNFIVFPSLGQIVEGYLLIASKKHYVSIGQIPEELYQELEFVCNKVKEILSENYTVPILFEHGALSEYKKGGGCITHAHIHAVPIRINILFDLTKYFKFKKIKDFEDIKEQFNKNIPYLFYESNFAERYLFEVAETIPS